MKLNKLLSLGAALSCGLILAACDSTPTESSSVNGSQPGNSTPVEENVSINVGLGYSASFNGTSQVDVTSAMVAFDASGKVVASRIDVVQVKLAVAEEAVTITNTTLRADDNLPKSKLELGKDYGMKGVSGSIGVIEGGLEVDAQIESYAAWTKGKTVSEINEAMVTVTQNEDKSFSDGRPHSHGGVFTNDPALWSTCTITVNGFAAAIENAFANKSETAVSVAKDFTIGVAQNSTMYNATTLNVDLGGAIVVDGKVAAAQADCIAVEFAIADGAISLKDGSNYYKDGKFVSKKALGDNYNMSKYGADANGDGTVLEWCDQIALVEAAAAGKTAEQVKVLEKHTADNGSSANVVAMASMNIDNYVKAIARAAVYADTVVIGPQA